MICPSTRQRGQRKGGTGMSGERLNIRKLVTVLAQLADGCPDHPEYRYNKNPTHACETCAELYVLRGRIESELNTFISGLRK